MRLNRFCTAFFQIHTAFNNQTESHVIAVLSINDNIHGARLWIKVKCILLSESWANVLLRHIGLFCDIYIIIHLLTSSAMDILCLMQPVAIFAFLGVAYLIIVSGRSSRKKDGHYSVPDWNFFIKKQWAKYVIRKWKKVKKDQPLIFKTEIPRNLKDEDSWDSKSFRLCNPDGSSLFVSIKKRKTRVSDVSVILALPDGTIYLLPNHPDTAFPNSSVENWEGGGLKLTVVEPFKKWRITFNGLLSKDIPNELIDSRSTIHIKFNFIWSYVQKPVFNIKDWSANLMAESISNEPWRHPQWIEMLDQWKLGGYHQFGSALGEVYIGSELEPSVLHLRGVRVRQWAQLGSTPIRRNLAIQGIFQDGSAYFLHCESYHEGVTQITHGSVRVPCGEQDAIDECDLKLQDFGEFKTYIPNSYTITVKAGKRQFKILIDLESHKKVSLKNGRPWDWENIIIPFQGRINGSFGTGFIYLGYSFYESTLVNLPNDFVHIKQLKWGKLTPNYSSKLCVDFNDHGAICPQLVGAKGASLALLHSAPTKLYTVPPAFCLTVNALNEQIASVKELSYAIHDVLSLAKEYNEVEMRYACERVVNLLKTSLVVFTVKSTVDNYLHKLRNNNEIENDVNKISFAVRSSGVGEDSDELSAAGQNATILGCRTNEDVIRAIQECWASLFSFQSVEYRRQHGQVANCGMGVVIQVVVEPQSAGVMFTRHPSTGNPSHILITSNYGLGESVVSGEVEPDTILLSRSYKNTINIDKIDVGKKTHKVIVKTDVQGTVNIQLDKGEVNLASLSDNDCLRLGHIALEQEALWGAPRDIEWAISNNKIYLLQARPITSLERWTEFELMHEFDTPIMSEEDMMTFANTGEVLPGAISALTHSTIVKSINEVVTIAANPKWKNTSGPESLTITHHHTGINLMNTLYRQCDKEISTSIKIIQLCILGHCFLDDRINSISLRRRPASNNFIKMAEIFKRIKGLWKGQNYLESVNYLSSSFKFNLDKCRTIEDVYKAIDDSLIIISECSYLHSNMSTNSIFSEIFAMSILLEGKKELTLDHYADIGRILSSCKDVISADVPLSLADITTAIQSSKNGREFSKLPTEKAQEWLEENCTEAAAKLQTFLSKHGHRSIKELDLATETWSMNKEGLLKTLQAGVSSIGNVGPGSGTAYPLTTEEIVSRLVSPKSAISKKLLKLIIPICQKAVCRRETSKEALMSLVHKFRMAYLFLARRMVEEWYIPEERLIFYMTHDEIGDLIKTRNPIYIAKAQHRRRLMPKWDRLRFKEVNEGCPQPLNANSEKIDLREGSTKNRLVGTPVCPGNIIGRACVVNNLSEIGQLQNGDILITHSTDIGWSPYYPLLSGVVTELGGLISHGAVVAREYGLPCIVGAQGATLFFKTGDTVLLAGAIGFIEKVDSTSNGTM